MVRVLSVGSASNHAERKTRGDELRILAVPEGTTKQPRLLSGGPSCI